jgi:hypothetical protein
VIAQMWALWQAKSGNPEAEYEDACCYSEGFAPGCARAAVADGASTAFEAQSWVNLLVRRFLDDTAPPLEAAAFGDWLGVVQKEWDQRSASSQEADTIYSIYDDDRAAEGTYGTFLGLELGGLDGDGRGSSWRALSIGDTVCFHVRGNTLVGQSPAMRADDFGRGPSLVHSSSEWLRSDCAAIVVDSGGPLLDGDVVLVATDAIAAWMVRRHESGAPVWDLAAGLDATRFSELVAALRGSGEMVNDDVTLLVARLTARRPAAQGEQAVTEGGGR